MAEVQARPLGVQFQEAISYLKGKLPESTLKWDDLAGPVHGKVFAVAGATSTDLVGGIQAALVDALAKGQTITAFRKDFDRLVQEHGWTYRGKRGWRTSVIFDTNMRTAHMAGRWEQLQASKDRRPFLQYRTAGDARVRPLHRQWNGLIFPIGDAFWQTHYPPNGWNCRCTVRAYSQADLDEKRLQVSDPVEIKTRNVVTRDGEIKDQVPVGIDPGWDHNVGQSWISPELALGQKLARLPRELQGLVVDKTISPAFQQVLGERWKAFQTGVNAGTVPAGNGQVVGYLDSATLEAVAAKVPELQLTTTAATAPDALVSKPKQIGAAVSTWPADWLDDLPANLRNYQAVLWDKVDGMLVVVPQGGFPGGLGRVGKITLKPNAQAAEGEALSVVSLDSASAPALRDANRYDLLVGKLK